MNNANPLQSELSLPTTGRFEWIDDKNELVFIKFTDQKSQKSIYSQKNLYKTSHMKIVDEIRTITIKDIKSAALTRLKASGKHFQYSQHFAKMIKSPECDKLLISLAKYLECYFKILKFEEKFADEKLLPNVNQLKEQEELHKRIDILKYDFSLAYAKFLLLERSLVHNICPRPTDPVATAKTDQNLYETFFWFFVFCMWITFLRTRFKEICAQIGWFTRSEMFNSLGRQGASYFGQKGELDSKNIKIYQTQLPRASMLNKCSPALRLILPGAEENIAKINLNKSEDKQRRLHMTETNVHDENEKIGILGDYRHLYDDQLILNKQTADRDQEKHEDDNENNDEEDQEKGDKKSV